MSTPNFQINKNLSPLVQLSYTGGLTYQGTYSAATAYVAGDVVTDGSGNSFVARQNTTGNATGNNAYWQTLADKGSTGATGSTGSTGSTGAAATIAVGSTSSVANDGTAAVSNSGSTAAAVFDFVLRDGPTGATGSTGATGAQGDPGVIQTVTAGTNLGGGGSAASVTLNLDTTLTGLSAVTSTALTASSTLNLDSVALTTVQTSAESFVDNDVTLMTAAAIEDRYGAGDGDITSVVAGTNLNGGGTSGDVTLNLDTTITGLSSVTSTAFVGALTGNASTAAALQTARDIGGVSFNGTSSIDLPGVNTAGNQATSGLAATATALATARAINGVDFDGTAPITVTAAAGTLTGSTLASGVTASSLTSVGTLSALTVGGTLTFDSVGLTAVQTSAETFVDNDTTLMTAAAAEDRYGGAGPGDITGVAAGTNLNGGGTSGDVTLNLDTTLTGLSSVTSTALVGALTGNADTATALATARAINGVDFDGTAAITVTAAAGTLSGATLAAGVTASSLTSVGTLASLNVTGDVGIGTTSPDAPLHLATSATTDTELLRLTGAWAVADRYAYIVGETSTDGAVLAAIGLGTAGRGANNNDGGISFLTTNAATTSISDLTEVMAIDHLGLVGIGGFVSARQLTVKATQTAFELWHNADVAAGAVTGGVVRIGAAGDNTNPDTGDYWILFRRGNGATIGSVRGTGSASVNFSTTSDATLKTDNGIVTEERIGSIMDTLQVHDFDWNEGTVTDQIGLFAQEAIDVLPESIVNAPSVEPATADEDEMYVAAALDYSKIVPILIAECQFLRARVDALESS